MAEDRNYDHTGGGTSSFEFMRFDDGKLVIGKDANEWRGDWLTGYLDGVSTRYISESKHAKIPPHTEILLRITTKDPRLVAAAVAAGTDTKKIQPSEFVLSLHSHWKGGLVPDALNTLLKKIEDPTWNRFFRLETWLKKREGNEPVPRCAFKEADGTKWEPYYPFDDATKTMPGVPQAKDPDFENFWVTTAKIIEAWYNKSAPKPAAQTTPITTQPAAAAAPEKPLGERTIGFVEKKWASFGLGTFETLVESGKAGIELLNTKYATHAEFLVAKIETIEKLNSLIKDNFPAQNAKFGVTGEFEDGAPKVETDDLPF